MSRLSLDMTKCATRRRRERGPMLWSGARSSPSLITIWERFLCAKATLPEAIAQFEQALHLHPDFPEAEGNLRLAKAGDPQFPSQLPPVEFWSVRAQPDSRLVLTVAGIADPGFGGAAGKGNPSSIRQNCSGGHRPPLQQMTIGQAAQAKSSG